MDGPQIRERFLAFFEERGHKRVPSSSLIPDDRSLLLTTAGMVQFKPYFLGLADPPYPRAASVQKSFRTTDIDNVGHTARHLTFFEMLGNFSFGDYFKKESISWGWELVTEGYGIDPDRIWVSVFEEDGEAARIWADEIGLSADRIVKRGKKDNFWSMGVAGPCGPSSEIFVDRGSEFGPNGGPAVDEERFLEIWNHVFMQYECDDDINVVGDLARTGVDTGASVERIAVVSQNVASVFETDLLRPMLSAGEELSGVSYGDGERTDVSLRILADHGRAATFLIADGVLPSNEGRGYVLRRMLRRLVSHARRLGIEKPLTGRLVDVTVETLGDAYPELRENQEFAKQVAASEEERFAATLRQGMTLFESSKAEAKKGVLSGDAAFKLHDTHGFPVELTMELAAEEGLEIDRDRFEELMQEQRTRAQAAAKKGDFAEEGLAESVARAGATEFIGYEKLEADTRIVGLIAPSEVVQEGEEVRVLLDPTPFYAEGGGQVGDTGIIRTETGSIRVADTQPTPGGAIVHIGVVESGEVSDGAEAHAEVDPERRAATARSHTATHVVHWTLRHLLGEHARQAGSLVAPGRLRFDFTHHSAVPAEQLEEAEYTANTRLAADDPVRAYETTMEYAKAEGAIALFGEKYGDLVRVVEVGDYSRELCGGTHVPHTGKVAVVRVLGESSIGSGLRRIEALVGPDALKEVNLERRLLQEVVRELGAGDPAAAPERARKLVERLKQLESAQGKLQKEQVSGLSEHVAARHSVVAGVRLVNSLQEGDADQLRALAQEAVGRLEGEEGAAVVLGSAEDGRALLVAALSKNLVSRGVNAPQLLEPAAKAVGGGAGGKPTLAFAGGKNAAAVEDALAGIPRRLEELLEGG
ncbi:MAG: alanine--tRNA ligase [Actinomycetota bacterium]